MASRRRAWMHRSDFMVLEVTSDRLPVMVARRFTAVLACFSVRLMLEVSGAQPARARAASQRSSRFKAGNPCAEQFGDLGGDGLVLFWGAS